MNHLDNRVFNEEYFIKKFGNGLPPCAYFFLAEKANTTFQFHKCLSAIEKNKYSLKSIERVVSEGVTTH